MSRLHFHSVTHADPSDTRGDRDRRRRMPVGRVVVACFVLLLLVAGGRFLQQSRAARQIPDPVDVAKHMIQARRMGQRMVLFFHDEREADSQRMVMATWSDPAVADVLTRGYRFVQLDPSAPNYGTVMEEYGFDRAPAIVVMTATGTILTTQDGEPLQRAGFVDATAMRSFLAGLATPTEPFHGQDAVRRRLD